MANRRPTTDHTGAVVAHYDERAATYDDSALHRWLTEEVADFVDEPGGDVLDVATGTGLMLRSLARRYDGLGLFGIDRSPAMLRVARTALPEAGLVLADAAAVPLADNAVDLITCVTALHLFPHAKAVVGEWARVVRPGGRIVTATFRPYPDHGTAGPWPDFPRRHADFCTPDLVASAFGPAGLSLERHRDLVHTEAGHEDRLLICELRAGLRG